MPPQRIRSRNARQTLKESQVFLTMLDTGIKDSDASKAGRKRLNGMGKRPNRKGTVVSAIKTLLNFLHISDKNRCPDDRPCPPKTWDNSRPDQSPLTTTGCFPLRDRKSKKSGMSKSKSWSYYIHHPFDELQDDSAVHDTYDQLRNEQEQNNEGTIFHESYFEDDYCEDYQNMCDDFECSRSSYLNDIKMGVSSLKLFCKCHCPTQEASITPYGEFRRVPRQMQASRKLYSSLPDLILVESRSKNCPTSEDSYIEEPSKGDQIVNSSPLGLNIVFDTACLDDSTNKDGDTAANQSATLSCMSQDVNPEKLISLEHEIPDARLETDHKDTTEKEWFGPEMSPKSKRSRTTQTSPVNTSTPDKRKTVREIFSPYFSCNHETRNDGHTQMRDIGLSVTESRVKKLEETRDGQVNINSSLCQVSCEYDQTETVGEKYFSGNSTRSLSLESGYDSSVKPYSPMTEPPVQPAQLSGSASVKGHFSEMSDMSDAIGNTSFVSNQLDCFATSHHHREYSSPRFSTTLKPGSEASETVNDRPVKSLHSFTSPLDTMKDPPSKPYDLPDILSTLEQGKSCMELPVITDQSTRNAQLENLNPSFRIEDTFFNDVTTFLDENGNNLSFNCHFPESQGAVTPASKILTPVSTSSPLQNRLKSTFSFNGEVCQLAPDFVSPVRGVAYNTPLCYSPERLTRKRRRKLYCPDGDLSPLSRKAITLNDVNNNPLVLTSSDDEAEAVSPSSTDYLLLKRSADLLVSEIPRKKEIKPFLRAARLLEFLNFFYLREIGRLSNKNTLTISEYKNANINSYDSFNEAQLTIQNCISTILLAALVNRPSIVRSCANFAFRNLHFLVKSPDFLSAAPEFVIFLLSNDHSVVLGPHGFPLAYKESEREIQRAIDAYVKANRTGNVQRDLHLECLVQCVIGAGLKTKSGVAKHNSQNYMPPLNSEGENVPSICNRPFHNIAYQVSKTLVSTVNSRMEYSFQPFLSSVTPSYQATDVRDLASRDLTSSSKATQFCNSQHTLRKLYFSFKHHNKVPYITRIELQYAFHGQKKLYIIGHDRLAGLANDTSFENERDIASSRSPPAKRLSFALDSRSVSTAMTRVGTSIDDDTDSKDDGTLPEAQTMTAIKLESMEHVTGVYLLGDAVLHNLEIRTNKGRRIRAHHHSECYGSSAWTAIPPPEGQSTFCLQALHARVKTQASRTYLRDIGAVWAVVSDIRSG